MGKNKTAQRPHHADIPQCSQQGDEEKKRPSAHLQEKRGGTDRRRDLRATDRERTTLKERFKESLLVYVMALEVQRPALRAAAAPDSEEEG